MARLRETKAGNRKKRKICAFECDLNFAKPTVSADFV